METCRIYFDCTRFKNSSLVLGSSRKTPNMVDVTVLLFIFCTPLMTIHMCLKTIKLITIQHFNYIRKYLRSLNNDSNTSWLNCLCDSHSNLLRQPFLDLKPPRIDLHDPGQLTQTQNLPTGQISDGHFAVERDQVVLAHREHLDVLHHHHLVVVLVEDCVVQHL